MPSPQPGLKAITVSCVAQRLIARVLVLNLMSDVDLLVPNPNHGCIKLV